MPFGGAVHLGDQSFHAPGAKLWHYDAELRTLSVTYPPSGSALTYTTDNPYEMCPLKLTDFCHQSYTILHGPLIPPMKERESVAQQYTVPGPIHMALITMPDQNVSYIIFIIK